MIFAFVWVQPFSSLLLLFATLLALSSFLRLVLGELLAEVLDDLLVLPPLWHLNVTHMSALSEEVCDLLEA